MVGPHGLPGLLSTLPAERALGIVLFAHGSGSSRLSPRNRVVAEALQREQLSTLLFDLLQADEADDRAKVFDIDLLATRLLQAMRWVREQPALAALPLGLFGASTGAAAALVAAAERPREVAAVVSRGGRPDLAGAALPQVQAPTLLIVGSLDEEVLALNREALRRMPDSAVHRLEVVRGATHLFEEAGALESVSRLARTWFRTHFERVRGEPRADAEGR
ncbi:MAG: dienelactone hydrolase family protein [Rubrivivax sp.]|nr:dienelactone hydrolase family protein [Rubrivivax sp.]